ncbi:MAG: PilZ domain-containing protein [Candidatus Melainabacteria bacterium]|nr:PilZ domain-containing protein [Candidatus Melainabacteria bacterium]
MYLLFNLHPLQALPLSVIIMALPHILVATLTNNYHYKNFRHSFWSEVYETTLAPYFACVTTSTLVNPRAGQFNVTPKGGLIKKYFFDFRMAWPSILILLLGLTGLIACCVRWLHSRDVIEQQSILLNAFWTFYNLILAMCAICVAIERPQRRAAHRISKQVPVLVRSNEIEHAEQGVTENLTEFGALLRLNAKGSMNWTSPGAQVLLAIKGQNGRPIELSATVRRCQQTANAQQLVGMQFAAADSDKIRSLIELIYCAPGTWAHLREPMDSIVGSYWNIVTTPMRVLTCTTLGLK